MLKIKKKNYFMKLIEVKNNILLGLDKFAKENQFKIVKKDFAIKKKYKRIYLCFRFYL